MKNVVDHVVAEVAVSEIVTVETVNLDHVECRGTQISCIAAKSLAKPPEACRPKEGLKSIAPKHPEALGRAIRRAPHGEAFIPDVKSWVSRAGWQGLQEHTDLRRSRVWGTQLGWQGHSHTRVLQDLGIKARRPRGGRFGVQTSSIASSHPAEP
jgi:hypothetical protein